MDSPLFVLPFGAEAEAFQLDPVETWWDGWEGVDRALKTELQGDGA